jgi:hypothetical protein
MAWRDFDLASLESNFGVSKEPLKGRTSRRIRGRATDRILVWPSSPLRSASRPIKRFVTSPTELPRQTPTRRQTDFPRLSHSLSTSLAPPPALPAPLTLRAHVTVSLSLLLANQYLLVKLKACLRILAVVSLFNKHIVCSTLVNYVASYLLFQVYLR